MNPAYSLPSVASAALIVLAAPGSAAAQGPPVNTRVFVIEQPIGEANARFGESVALLDFDGDGDQDVAIGAPGQSTVYVALRADGPGLPRWDRFIVIPSPGGPGTAFGMSLATGSFDGDASDELLVGDPTLAGGKGGAYVIGAGDPFTISTQQTAAVHFGAGVGVGDFDGDGKDDLAVGSPQAAVGGLVAGRVDITLSPLGELPRHLVLENPLPTTNGNFGLWLAVTDTDGDGLSDLIVSSVANDSSAGIPIAGQVYVYPGPIDPHTFQVLEDPTPDAADPPRFGMHVAARNGLISIGSPRKDTGGVEDTGMGFVFRGSSGAVTSHLHAHPGVEDILGYRTAIFDARGSAQPDLAFISLKNKAAYVWDGDDPLGEPRSIRVLADSGSHFCNGICSGQLLPGGREELVLGDPTWHVPGSGMHRVGRVVVYAP